MKILKKLGIIALLLIGAFLVVGLFVGKEVKTERSLVMNAPPAMAFEQVNDLSNWANWGPWQKEDATMKITLGEKSIGEGGSYSWVSENSGNGKLTILKSEPTDLIETKLEFEGMGESNGTWTFAPEGGGTKVTWGFAFEIPYPFNASLLFSSPKKELNEMFDSGLSGIKEIVEKNAAEAAAKAAALLQMQNDSIQLEAVKE